MMTDTIRFKIRSDHGDAGLFKHYFLIGVVDQS